MISIAMSSKEQKYLSKSYIKAAHSISKQSIPLERLNEFQNRLFLEGMAASERRGTEKKTVSTETFDVVLVPFCSIHIQSITNVFFYQNILKGDTEHRGRQVRRTGRNDGSACEIFAEYKIGDNWQIAPGYMAFNGPKDSRLGQFKDNDMVYLRLRYNF